MAASKVTQGEAAMSSGQEELHALIQTQGDLYCCTELCLCDGGLTACLRALDICYTLRGALHRSSLQTRGPSWPLAECGVAVHPCFLLFLHRA